MYDITKETLWKAKTASKKIILKNLSLYYNKS